MKKENRNAATAVEVNGREIKLLLASGQRVFLPVEKFPRLAKATEAQLALVRLRRGGEALRWDEIDEDIQVSAILQRRWPAHGGVRPGAGRKKGINLPITARISKDLLSTLRRDHRTHQVPQAAIINDALRLWYTVNPSGGAGEVNEAAQEIDLSNFKSLKPDKGTSYVGLSFKLMKRRDGKTGGRRLPAYAGLRRGKKD